MISKVLSGSNILCSPGDVSSHFLILSLETYYWRAGSLKIPYYHQDNKMGAIVTLSTHIAFIHSNTYKMFKSLAFSDCTRHSFWFDVPCAKQ